MEASTLVRAVNVGYEGPRPTIEWPGGTTLAEVSNPFGLAQASGANLSKLLSDDPHGGDIALEFWVQVVREAIDKAFDEGAQGILYRLHGACAKWNTPMQYGGYYLERDREILSEAMSRGFTALFVVGGEDTFLDVVSDLPAHAIGWDVGETGYSVAAMKEMRQGATFTTEPESEIALVPSTDGHTIADYLEGELAHV